MRYHNVLAQMVLLRYWVTVKAAPLIFISGQTWGQLL